MSEKFSLASLSQVGFMKILALVLEAAGRFELPYKGFADLKMTRFGYGNFKHYS